MKKINLFNKTISPLSDGKGCPVERGGVWELPRRTPCATPSWKEGERKVPSYRRMPVSRGIVENRHTAEARCPGIAIAMTCPAGDFSSQGDEKHNVCDAVTAPAIRRAGWVPAFAGMTMIVIAALFATPSFAEPTELDKKTVASKAYVDTKQDKITTGLVEFDDLGVTATVPALVVTNSTGTALNGNTIGFLDLETYGNLNAGLDELPDTLVPSIGLIDAQLQNIWNNMPSSWAPLTWNNTQSTAINAYNSTFGDGTNQWAGNSNHLINGGFLANSLALKQNKIPAGTAGNVVTYSGTAGTVGSVATANAPTYNETTGVLENGTNIATIAAVDTRQKKMTCAGWDSETHTDEHCWLWSIEE